MTYPKLFSLALLCISIGLFSSCQEEDAADFYRSPTAKSPIGSGLDDFQTLLPSENESFITGATWLRLPIPCPRPRSITTFYLGGRQCDPGILEITLQEGSKVFDVDVTIVSYKNGLYASSDEKYGGGFEAKGNRAEAYVVVVNDELAKQPLVQLVEVSYIDPFGKERTERIKGEFTFDQ